MAIFAMLVPIMMLGLLLALGRYEEAVLTSKPAHGRHARLPKAQGNDRPA